MTIINILIWGFALILSISVGLGFLILLIFLFTIYPLLLIKYNLFTKKYIQNYNPQEKNINSIIIINYLFKRKINNKIKINNRCKPIISLGIPKLIYKLDKYNREIAIYENINSNIFEQIMKSKNIEEIYIFSHGQRFGVELFNKFYRYKDLLKITPRIKKNVICQLHCGGLKKAKSTDISLEQFANKSKIYKRDMCFCENWFWVKYRFDTFYKK